jgi:hypothetical protein
VLRVSRLAAVLSGGFESHRGTSSGASSEWTVGPSFCVDADIA